MEKTMSVEEKLNMIEHLTTNRVWASFTCEDKDFDVIVSYRLTPETKSHFSKEFFSVEIFDDFMQWAVVNLYDVEVWDATKQPNLFKNN